MEPRLELVVLEPPDVVAFAFTGTPNEFIVKEAERLKKEKKPFFRFNQIYSQINKYMLTHVDFG